MILLNCIVLNFIECHFKHAMLSVNTHIIYYPFVFDFNGSRFMNVMFFVDAHFMYYPYYPFLLNSTHAFSGFTDSESEHALHM